ncbi:uncharacterized protein B0H64DRAFT_95243 [Chaetomium fimeti]|uniref:Uncharacterized protein n=1 Tax=Chaetomium fimeti TaxID=1854472 RepID=A0AAE0HP45_9PEZI|nr:hypothetical protein B0H64DRAFT_95243 [Chaetomium fimeti]
MVMGLLVWTVMVMGCYIQHCADIIAVGLSPFWFGVFGVARALVSCRMRFVYFTPESRASASYSRTADVCFHHSAASGVLHHDDMRAPAENTRNIQRPFFHFRGYRDRTTQRSPNREKTASSILRCNCMSLGRPVRGLQRAQFGMRGAGGIAIRPASSCSRRTLAGLGGVSFLGLVLFVCRFAFLLPPQGVPCLLPLWLVVGQRCSFDCGFDCRLPSPASLARNCGGAKSCTPSASSLVSGAGEGGRAQ